MLNTEEKDKYINFLLRNKISPQQDESSERYVAKFKIKAPEVSRYKENNPPTRRRSLSNRDQAATYRRGSIPIKPKETKPPLNNKSPFVLASKATKKPAVFRGDPNSSSFITFDNQTNQPRASNLIDLIEKVEINQSPLFGISRANRLDTDEREDDQSNNEYSMIRSKSVPNVVEKKLNFEEISISPAKRSARPQSIVRRQPDNAILDSMEYFKELAKLVNMQEIVKKGRPKKLVLDNVSKTIEEIFTLRFYRESEILRAVTNNKQKEIQNESFTEFVYSCLKEKYKTKSLREQNGSAFVFSVYLYRNKHTEIEIFARILHGDFDQEDLTFFLFVRSIVEKELNLAFHLRGASLLNTMLNNRNCYKILSQVYGAEEKLLINRMMSKIKAFVQRENEETLDFGNEKINVYKFMKLAIEDYHTSRQAFIDSLIGLPTDDSVIINHDKSGRLKTSFSDITNQSLNLQSVRTSNENSIQVHHKRKLSQNSKLQAIESEGDEDNEGHFSFRGNENSSAANLSAYLNQEKQTAPPTKNNNNNQPSKPLQRRGSRNSFDNSNALFSMCMVMALNKLDEFVDATLFQGRTEKTDSEEDLKFRLLSIMQKKLKKIVKALFSFDKIQWDRLDALSIKKATIVQIQNCESLQKDLRMLQRKSYEEQNHYDVDMFVSKILKTPEISEQISRVVVEQTTPTSVNTDTDF